MTAPAQWLSAFPLQQAQGAVTALIEGWTELAAVHRPHFNASTKEPGLTKRLKIFVENEVARRHGLLGMWSTEDIIGDVDPLTGALVEERRTDIVYGWNDASHRLFEDRLRPCPSPSARLLDEVRQGIQIAPQRSIDIA